VNDARQLLELGEGSPLALLEGLVRRHEAKLRILDAVAMESEATIELAGLRAYREPRLARLVAPRASFEGAPAPG
jgi:hypothetical protein